MELESIGRSNKLWALAIGLGFAVSLAHIAFLDLPREGGAFLIYWFTSGIPLAALLRTPRRQWPLLIAASIMGSAAPIMLDHGASPWVTVQSISGAIQYIPCAYILRRRFGSYFELSRLDHLSSLAGLGLVTTWLRTIVLIPLTPFSLDPIHTDFVSSLLWFTGAFLGLFVFSLPLLAISSRATSEKSQFDRGGAILLAALAVILTLCFGPPSMPMVFIVMPVLMALAWRHGLRGAGVGTLLTIIMALAFTYSGFGIGIMLGSLGYGPWVLGFYLETFFCITLLSCMPIAVLRSRQSALTEALVDSAKRDTRRVEGLKNLYSALAACNAAFTRCTSLEELTDTICRILVQNGNMKLAWVGFANRDSELMEPYSYYGSGSSYLKGLEISVRADDPRGSGPTGTAFRENQPVWCNDFMTDNNTALWQERAAQFGWRGSGSLPLRRKEQPIGTLTMYTDEIGFFDEESQILLNDMAVQFSMALDAIDAKIMLRQSLENVAASERRFRAMFESAPLGIAVVDSETGNFVDANPMFTTISGWSRDALLSKRWQDITHTEDLEANVELAARYTAGEISDYQIDTRYVREDGEVVWVNMTIAHFAMPGSTRQSNLCMIEDISTRKELDNQIHIAQRMEAIGQLTGGIAHDFNNLLTVIIGCTEALSAEVANPRQHRLVELALKAGGQCAELTQQMLAFARRQPLTPRAFDANELVGASEALISRTIGENLRLSIRKAAGLHMAFADPLQTETAILNLCLNARDAMPQGGELIIETDNVTIDENYTQHHPDAKIGDYVMIAVHDTGTGIGPDIMDHIFEPYFTSKPAGAGTGLGLSMVYGFIQQSHGHISVESRLGAGTTFRLYLPVAAANADKRESNDQTEKSLIGGREHILIVEDNELLNEHVRRNLESLGYQVTAANNAAMAIVILSKCNNIDLLFTDVVMPGGMTGLELGALTADRWPSVRILYTTGYAQDTLTKDGRLIEGIRLLPKPFSKTELARKVREVFDSTR